MFPIPSVYIALIINVLRRRLTFTFRAIFTYFSIFSLQFFRFLLTLISVELTISCFLSASILFSTFILYPLSAFTFAITLGLFISMPPSVILPIITLIIIGLFPLYLPILLYLPTSYSSVFIRSPFIPMPLPFFPPFPSSGDLVRHSPQPAKYTTLFLFLPLLSL